MLVFYIRCSTEDQNEARQMAMAEEHNAEKIFCEKVSGKDTNRDELNKMLAFVREGDTVMTESISRIARNTKDLLEIVEELNEKGVEFVSLKEAIDTRTPQGKFMLTIFAAIAELDREHNRQRQAEGIQEAKKIPGKYQGRKPTDIDKKKFTEMCERWRAGEITAVSIQKRFEISAPTFYKRVKDWGL
jgi:DNA invertase Pin-like site-specific DNA recombinase